MNLFEQQAQALRAARPAAMRPEPSPPAPVRRVSALEMMGFIERASLGHCAQLARSLSARLHTLEKSHAGMRAANIEEAAKFAADAALNLESVPGMAAAQPCTCGRCDDCRAARSDKNYARRRDATLA